MAASFADSESDVSYSSRFSGAMATSTTTRTSTSTGTTNSSTSACLVPSSRLLEGLEARIQIQTFSTVSNLRDHVRKFTNQLFEHKASTQYLVFQRVKADDFDKIEDQRHSINKGMLLTYCSDIDTLIIKVPSGDHEVLGSLFSDKLKEKFGTMGLSAGNGFLSLGSTTFRGTSVSKEADKCYKPLPLRSKRTDWPTLVIEVGLSESLTKLRIDAEWWLTNSKDLVNIVLIIHLSLGSRTIQIERWECASATTGRVTRSRAQAQIPTQMQAITINQNGVTGQLPLVLDFQKIFLRQPTPPEQDVTYTAQELQRLADELYAAMG